jgi:membrane-bound lytic murein transglycosylase A
MRRALLALLFVVGIVSFSCQRLYRVQITDPADALVPLEAQDIPTIRDDMDMASLKEAIMRSLQYLDRLPPQRTFRFGPRLTTSAHLKETLEAFLELIETAQSREDLFRAAAGRFRWYQAAGYNIFRDVLFTGYYVPVLEGSLRPHGPYKYPIYRRPPELLDIPLGLFRASLKGILLRGMIQGQRVVPYYSRAEIDLQNALEGRGLEIAWLKDPVDRFFLHIQGSGKIIMDDGSSIFVSYASSNGHPYRSIGRLLVQEDVIPAGRISMQAIRTYLAENPQKMHEILSHNPSYVFFRIVDDGPRGSLDVPLTAGRSLATDPRFFPRGALAFIDTEAPRVNEKGTGTIRRFVLNQDTGGAIRGSGRADLFFGLGSEAESLAGRMRHKGRLYFLLLK